MTVRCPKYVAKCSGVHPKLLFDFPLQLTSNPYLPESLFSSNNVTVWISPLRQARKNISSISDPVLLELSELVESLIFLLASQQLCLYWILDVPHRMLRWILSSFINLKLHINLRGMNRAWQSLSRTRRHALDSFKTSYLHFISFNVFLPNSYQIFLYFSENLFTHITLTFFKCQLDTWMKRGEIQKGALWIENWGLAQNSASIETNFEIFIAISQIYPCFLIN